MFYSFLASLGISASAMFGGNLSVTAAKDEHRSGFSLRFGIEMILDVRSFILIIK